MLAISQAISEVDLDSVRTLFREYESALALDLCFQGFEEELVTLPGAYRPPSGSLLLARSGEVPAGCVGLRKLDEVVCEMKRLYVRPAFRGIGLGNMLIEKLITEARAFGYGRMRLDTLPPKMGKAVSLYESHGFRLIPPYNDNPHEDVLFMELQL